MVAQAHRQKSSFSKLTLELVLEVRALPLPFADQTTNRMQTGKECEREELAELNVRRLHVPIISNRIKWYIEFLPPCTN